MYHHNSKINEGLEKGDLERLVHTELHIDEFKSKMGEDKDIVVVSFKIGGKEPALDLVNFIEKGYDWVLDADTSSGEMDDGDYIVFLELPRTPRVPAQIIELLTDMVLLTGNELEEYRVRYHKEQTDSELSKESLKSLIPSTPEEYLKRVAKESDDIDRLKMQAGVDVKTRAPDNEYTESLRIAAGIL